MSDLETLEPISCVSARIFEWQVLPNRDATDERNQEQYDRIPERTDELTDDTANVAELARTRIVSAADITASRSVQDTILRAVDAFTGAIRTHLREDCNDAIESGDQLPTVAASESCMRLARLIAPTVAMHPAIKRAAFSENDGSVSLVLQSLASDRRVTYRIDADGRRVNVLATDEHMQSTGLAAQLTDTSSMKERAEWVVHR